MLTAWPRWAFAVLCLAALAGFLAYPTYPNYDSYYSLLWGQEILSLEVPHFEGWRVPTEHPLAIAAGAVLSLFGEVGDRLWIAMILAGFLLLVAGVFRLGRVAFTPVVGAIAAILLLTRFDFAFLAARGYIDIPYMALVVWALVLEVQRPRRGTVVFLLLAAAGLLRVEGWLLAGLYWMWMFPASSWPERARWAALAAVAPAGWMLTDFVVTGDPLFSITYTSGSAEDLGRSRSFAEIPGALPSFFASLVKLPVLVCAIAGVVLSAWLVPRRSAGPLVLLLTGVGTFMAIAAAGASVIERYLVVAALGLLLFAAVTVGGWSLLRPGRLRSAWMWTAIVAVTAGAAWTAVKLDLRRFDDELRFRGDAHRSLVAVLEAPGVRDALACGPLTFPNHKLVPDGRWVADLPFEAVRARSEIVRRDLEPPDGGVAVFATSRMAIYKHAYTDPADPASIQVPPDGWVPVARTDHYAAYARC